MGEVVPVEEDGGGASAGVGVEDSGDDLLANVAELQFECHDGGEDDGVEHYVDGYGLHGHQQ